MDGLYEYVIAFRTKTHPQTKQNKKPETNPTTN